MPTRTQLELLAGMANLLRPDWPVMRVLGLSECVAHLEGRMALDEAMALAQQKTRNYAKRQMTWFRNRMPHYSWYDPLQSNIITQFKQISA